MNFSKRVSGNMEHRKRQISLMVHIPFVKVFPIWSLSTIMKAFEKLLPEVDELFKKGIGKYGTPEEADFIDGAYTLCKSISDLVVVNHYESVRETPAGGR